MVLLGLLLLLTGLVMNVRVLLGPYRARMTPAQIMKTPPWLLSGALICMGVLVMIVSGKAGH